MVSKTRPQPPAEAFGVEGINAYAGRLPDFFGEVYFYPERRRRRPAHGAGAASDPRWAVIQ